MDPILIVKDFSCGYRSSGFRVEGVSFEIREGEFVALLGSNGAGKSTLFKGLSGDIPLLSGEVIFRGKPLGQYSRGELARRLAVVSQFPEEAEVTAGEMVMMGRLPYRKRFSLLDSEEDLSKVRYYMEITGTIPLIDRQVLELSGGERQMVAIASALAQEPSLILLDEPTSHLDLSHQIRFLELLKRLNREKGLTVLLIIHDLNLASEYCDYLLLMSGGRVAFQGTPWETFTREKLEAVYGIPLLVEPNPRSGRPMALPASGGGKDQERSAEG